MRGSIYTAYYNFFSDRWNIPVSLETLNQRKEKQDHTAVFRVIVLWSGTCRLQTAFGVLYSIYDYSRIILDVFTEK